MRSRLECLCNTLLQLAEVCIYRPLWSKCASEIRRESRYSACIRVYDDARRACTVDVSFVVAVTGASLAVVGTCARYIPDVLKTKKREDVSPVVFTGNVSAFFCKPGRAAWPGSWLAVRNGRGSVLLRVSEQTVQLHVDGLLGRRVAPGLMLDISTAEVEVGSVSSLGTTLHPRESLIISGASPAGPLLLAIRPSGDSAHLRERMLVIWDQLCALGVTPTSDPPT